jgi:Tfp pilus assembly protein PilZ
MGVRTMIQELAEKRSEFRFPVVVPIEYFKPNDSAILSYALDLSNRGTFISSDVPLNIGSRFGMNLTIPVNDESSKIFQTEGTVVWDKVQPFQSKRNGMGVQFIEPLPESLLLKALANNITKLIKESESKKALEERVEKLESELEETKRLATLGRCTEKILFDLSNPILTLSGKLEIIKTKLHKYKKILEEQDKVGINGSKKIIAEFDNCCKNIDQILKDYKIISDVAHIVGDDREGIERRLLERYR